MSSDPTMTGRVLSGRPSKIYDVAVNQMRIPPALLTQREFRKGHGDRLAADFKFEKLGLLVLNHRDHIFLVLDGQHRVYAIKKLFGDDDGVKVRCEVYEGLTDPEMADIFLGRDDRRRIATFDKFHVACTAGHKRENDVRRMVESNGLRIGRVEEDKTIGAVGALCTVYDRSGEVVLGQTLRALSNGFAGDHSAFRPELLKGTGLVFNRFNGRTNEALLVKQLSGLPHGVRGLVQRAQSLRERTGNQLEQCVAATIVEIYNRGAGQRGKDRLTDWWKGSNGAANEK